MEETGDTDRAPRARRPGCRALAVDRHRRLGHTDGMDRIVTARQRRDQIFDVRTRSSQHVAVEAGASGPEAAGPGPMELMLVSLATCAGSTLEEVVGKMRYPARDIRVLVDGVRATSPPRVWTDIRLTYLLRSDLSERRLHRAMEVTERVCSAYGMLSQVAAISSEIIGVGRVESTRTLGVRQRVLRPGRTQAETRFDGEDRSEVAWFGAFRPGAGDIPGEVVGSAAVFPEASLEGRSGWRIRGVATDEVVRGMGVGGLILDAVLEHVGAEGGGLVWANVRLTAQAFYESRGFAVVGEVFEVPGVGPHVRMQVDGVGPRAAPPLRRSGSVLAE